MRIAVFAVLALGLTAALPAAAKEGGCAKDGAVGAVAGHFVGKGHAVAGAAAGCAVGVHRRHQAEHRQEQQRQNQDPKG
ncbi:hypothetical protein E0493_16025 [Roseomonas sp. M0104]|uniref:Glycine zipper 2TM domain-containing protein n=1 Tax=Teichococcus coralli TaxID=2545983 RepID=A0A845BCJ5_9PROT|nr:hypothetical protein [Pseudoroseomonas coralli]MXP64861.1 hypothetical protein [Pseudoroseomonas coralli]